MDLITGKLVINFFSRQPHNSMKFVLLQNFGIAMIVGILIFIPMPNDISCCSEQEHFLFICISIVMKIANSMIKRFESQK